ncbi:hypothetical protein Tco_1172340 [Tanacetum coccineum]
MVELSCFMHLALCLCTQSTLSIVLMHSFSIVLLNLVSILVYSLNIVPMHSIDTQYCAYALSQYRAYALNQAIQMLGLVYQGDDMRERLMFTRVKELEIWCESSNPRGMMCLGSGNIVFGIWKWWWISGGLRWRVVVAWQDKEVFGS